MSKIVTAPSVYRNSSAYPIRFDRLHPGSTFKIVSEVSRGIRRSNDDSLYRKSREGFFAERISDGTPAVLMPEDLVMPMVKDRARE